MINPQILARQSQTTCDRETLNEQAHKTSALNVSLSMYGSHQEGEAKTLNLTYWVEEITHRFEEYVQVLFLQQRKKN